MKSLDLEYLQWLQKHGKIYLTAFTVLTLSLCAGGYYWFQDHQQTPDNSQVMVDPLPENKPVDQNTENDAGQNSGLANTPEPSMQTALPADQNTEQEVETDPKEGAQNNIKDSERTEDNAQKDDAQSIIDGQLEENKNEDILQLSPKEEMIEKAVDPLLLPGYQSPCQGKVIGTFGMGYDLIYHDYRYHDVITYQPSQQDVWAVWDGTITAVVSDEANGQLVLQNEQYNVTYQGLTTITAADGDKVTKGQVIASAKDQFTIQVVQRESK